MIDFQQLNKSFGSVDALSNLSLSVPTGCLFGLLGPNGAGKTTALNILCTLILPDKGSVFLEGIDVIKYPRLAREKIGYVAQDVAIDKILTGRELLEFQGELYHLSHNQKQLRLKELIDILGMETWIDRRCGTYSGGMRRRLDLAAGLLHKPQVLVLDEPTVGLDIESRATVWSLLRKLKEEGITILLSSHYLEEVEVLADRLAIVDKGRVIAEGTPDGLKSELGGDRVTLRVREFSTETEATYTQELLKKCPGVKRVVINQSQGYSLNLIVQDDGVLNRLRTELSQANLPVFALSHSRPSLDDVYLQATGQTLTDAELAVTSQRDSKVERKKAMR
uniref:Putative multidrug efflux ABC transporter n=1 Tax=Paulinella chromatophora TaxID=39717 RepID=B1X5E5_PAUCH|nr:putative multidrug efflux ABC transporter [Paulinella chromatophora]ACB43164.1 putative multidrug efflux ABC transporter [Paulinella chromatophora]